MKIKLTQDLYRYENGERLVFARKGDILEAEAISEKVDWLVGCRTTKLVQPLDNGQISLLGEGYQFEILKTSEVETNALKEKKNEPTT